MNSAVVFIGLLALVSGQTTNVHQCFYLAGANTLPLNAYIDGCTDPPCSLAQLSDVTLTITFQAPHRIENMYTEAYAYFFGSVSIKFETGNGSVPCDSLTNTHCPLLTSEVAEYKLRLFIEPWLPVGTSLPVEFVIKDEADNSVITCLRIPITITPPTDNSLNNWQS